MSGKYPLLINYVHKMQGLDKSLPVCFSLKKNLGFHIVTVLDFEDKTRINKLGAFTELIEDSSDAIYSVSRFGSKFELIDQNKNNNYLIFEKNKYDILLSYLSKISRVFQARYLKKDAKNLLNTYSSEYSISLLLTIYNGVSMLAGSALASTIKQNGGIGIGYQKSIHDQGRGLTDLSKSSAKHSNRIKMKPYLDYFLVPDHSEYRTLLESKGISLDRQISAGYPICYPEWKEAVMNTTYVNNFQKDRRPLEVVLFARGEAVHKPKDDQIISDEWLLSAIEDILKQSQNINSEFRLRIKPHPYQDVHLLEDYFSDYSEVELTWQPPSVLAVTADLAIATYSSTILDAIAMGVPSIEYFHENKAFKRNHPDGSPFGAFGAFIARDKAQLQTGFKLFESGKLNGKNLDKFFGCALDWQSIEKILYSMKK